MVARYTSVLALFALVTFSACDDPELEKKSLIACVYNEQTMTGELNHLNTIDVSKLTELEKSAVTIRREDLEKMRQIIAAETNPIINIARCLPASQRPPPGPCPLTENLLSELPIGTHIELDWIGAFMDIAEASNPQARVLADQGTAQLVTTDGKKIFAQGTFYSYDSLFHTAWYTFDVKNRTLALRPLVLKITTQVMVNQQIKPVTIEKPIPAGTFLYRNN